MSKRPCLSRKAVQGCLSHLDIKNYYPTIMRPKRYLGTMPEDPPLPTSSKYKLNPRRSHYQLLHALTTPPTREMGEITLLIGMAKTTRPAGTQPDLTLMGQVYLTCETIGVGLGSNNSTHNKFRSGSSIMHTRPKPDPHICMFT